MTISEFPRFKPGPVTLKQTLEGIISTVREDSLRLNMDTFIGALYGQVLNCDGLLGNDGYPVEETSEVRLPPCGTIGCGAGIGGIMLTGRELYGSEFMRLFYPHFTIDSCGTPSADALWAIFMDTYADDTEPQSPEQAEWLAGKLTSYIAQYSKELDTLVYEVT